jgi:hypothetical protein
MSIWIIYDAYLVLYNSYAYYGLSYVIKVSVREPGFPAVVGGINRRVFAYFGWDTGCQQLQNFSFRQLWKLLHTTFIVGSCLILLRCEKPSNNTSFQEIYLPNTLCNGACYHACILYPYHVYRGWEAFFHEVKHHLPKQFTRWYT